MKKLLFLIFLFCSFFSFAQSPIVGGNGQCVTQGDPNLNATFNNPATRDICYRIYDETNNIWYSFDATEAAGSKYVKEKIDVKSVAQNNLIAYVATVPTDKEGTVIELLDGSVWILKTGGNPATIFDWMLVKDRIGAYALVIEDRVEADMAAVIAVSPALPIGYTVRPANGKIYQLRSGGNPTTLNDWVQIEGENNRVFASSAAVTVVTPGSPTVAEMQTYVTAQLIKSTLVYYTGTVTSTDAPTFAYWVDASGVVTKVEGGLSSAISGLTAATAVNSISNGDFVQTWDWNTATATPLNITSTSTARATNSAVQNVASSGANAAASITAIGQNIDVTNTGATNTNIGLKVTASGGVTNKPLVVVGDAPLNQQQLTIQGSTNADRQLLVGYNTTDNYGLVQSIEQGVGFKDLILNGSGGNVGVGTTTPTTKLSVKSPAVTGLAYSANFGQTGTVAGDASVIGFSAEGTAFSKSAIGHIRTGSFDRGDMIFLNSANNTTATNAVIGDEKMRITSGGNVGIGTTTPSVKLHNNGGLIEGASTTLANQAGAFMIPATTLVANTVVGLIQTSNNVAFTLENTGCFQGQIVNISHQSTGTGITVNGEALTASRVLRFIFDGQWRPYGSTAATNNDWGLLGNAGTVQATNFIGTSDNIGLSLRTNNAIRQTVTAAGDVGIGTTTPVSKLQVFGNAAIGIQTDATDGVSSIGANILNVSTPTKLTTNAITAPETALRLYRAGTVAVKFNPSADFQIGTFASAATLAFTKMNIRLGNGDVHTPDTDVMTMQSNGNVGIGTTTPVSTLDVAGAQILRPVTLANFAANAAIGTAAATVDIASTINIPQTTAGISLTISNPTNTQAGRILTISNTGTASVTVGGEAIPAGRSVDFVFTTVWSPRGATASVSKTINAQTGTTYTTAAGDGGQIVTVNNAAAKTVTLSNLASGTTTTFINLGAGTLNFVSGTLTRLHVANLFTMAGTNSVVTVTVVGTNAYLSGDLQ